MDSINLSSSDVDRRLPLRTVSTTYVMVLKARGVETAFSDA